MLDHPTTPELAADIASAATTSASSPAPRNRRRVPIWLRVILWLVCYVLSIGPMFWTWHAAEYFGGNPLIRVVYVPLRLLCSIPFVEDWLNRYINWWNL